MAETFEKVAPVVWRGSAGHMIYKVRVGKDGTGFALWTESPITRRVSTHETFDAAVAAANE